MLLLLSCLLSGLPGRLEGLLLVEFGAAFGLGSLALGRGDATSGQAMALHYAAVVQLGVVAELLVGFVDTLFNIRDGA